MSEVITPYASRITGIGSAFPEHAQSNQELADKLAASGVETSDEWIRERTGIRERRVSKPGDESENNSSLGLRAALEAMEMSGTKPEDIEQIIYCTCSPDTLIPSTACWLQKKMGAKNAWAYDINAACSGFVYGLTIANAMISAGSQKTILVVGAEKLTSFLNYEDRTSCILFGDGAGAAVVQQVPTDSKSKIISTHVGSDGNLWELFYMPAGGSNLELTPERFARHEGKMHMKGREIFKIATRTLVDYAVKALEKNGLTKEDIDWIVPHQANLRIIEAVASRLDISMDKILINVDRFGNTSSATVPTAFSEAVRDGRIKSGDLVLFDVFGAGLTYGSILLRW